LGRVHLLVNNAGVVGFTRFAVASYGDIEYTLTLDLLAAIHLARLVLDDMLERGSGHIVNISTLLATVPVPLIAVYGAAKAERGH
jgi:short-subunit dehydrogenase